MHIAYIISPGGGPEAYVRTLLSWFQARGHQITVIYLTRSLGDVHAFPKTVRMEQAVVGSLHYYASRLVGDFHAWPKRIRAWEGAWVAFRALKRIDREHPIDIVEVPEGMPLALIRRQWAAVIRAHGSAWTFHHFCNDGPVNYDLIHQEGRQLRQAHIVSALSYHLAQHLSQFCEYDLEQIHVVPYPIDTLQFSPMGENSLAVKTPAILSIGRLEHRKGTDVLTRALPIVWKHFPDLHAYFLGKEAQFAHQELLQQVSPEKRSQVVFPGFVSHEELPGFYRAATIYVAPTQYETFGYTILEAMACGLPIVSCPVGAVPELVEHGVNGLLVPFGDPGRLSEAITTLLRNADLRSEMGKRNRQKALMFATERIGPQMENLYRKAISLHQQQ